MKNLYYIFFAAVLSLTTINATAQQNINIKVKDSVEGAALSSVKIEPFCTDLIAYTNTEGNTDLQLPLTSCCNIKISKLGFAIESVKICPGEAELDVTLYKSFAVKGTVTDEAGKALDRARITLRSDCGDGRRVTYSNAAGRFQVTPPAIGECCYQMDIEHIETPKNTFVFCTTDEVQGKDINLKPTITAEKFNVLEVEYIAKTISAPRTNTATVATYTPASSAPTIINTTPLPTYTPPAPVVTSSLRSKYINPSDMTISESEPAPEYYSYFDFNKYNIRTDGYPKLDNLAAFLIGNPEIVLQVAVHCDSRGSVAYNQLLSERRARSLANYLVGRGITKNRLIVNGYGETQLINECTDGVTCTEAQHVQNRRAVFQFQGSIYDPSYTQQQSYEAYTPPAQPSYIPTPATSSTPPASTTTQPTNTPAVKVPCPDCPLEELDNEEYMDKLYDEEYFEDDGGE